MLFRLVSGTLVGAGSLFPDVPEGFAENAQSMSRISDLLWEKLTSGIGLVLLIGGSIVGLAVIGLGARLSISILRGAGVARPVAVTWSSIGIGRAIFLLIGGLIPVSLWAFPQALAAPQVAEEFGFELSEAVSSQYWLLNGALLIIAALVQAGIGALTTWWMASVYHSRARRPG